MSRVRGPFEDQGYTKTRSSGYTKQQEMTIGGNYIGDVYDEMKGSQGSGLEQDTGTTATMLQSWWMGENWGWVKMIEDSRLTETCAVKWVWGQSLPPPLLLSAHQWSCSIIGYRAGEPEKYLVLSPWSWSHNILIPSQSLFKGCSNCFSEKSWTILRPPQLLSMLC